MASQARRNKLNRNKRGHDLLGSRYSLQLQESGSTALRDSTNVRDTVQRSNRKPAPQALFGKPNTNDSFFHSSDSTTGKRDFAKDSGKFSLNSSFHASMSSENHNSSWNVMSTGTSIKPTTMGSGNPPNDVLCSTPIKKAPLSLASLGGSNTNNSNNTNNIGHVLEDSPELDLPRSISMVSHNQNKSQAWKCQSLNGFVNKTDEDGFCVPSQQQPTQSQGMMDLSFPSCSASSKRNLASTMVPAGLGSQFSQNDFCTPQDADVSQKTMSQINDELHNARLPTKKARVANRTSKDEEQPHHRDSAQVLVEPPKENPFLPLPSELVKKKLRPKMVNANSRLLRDFEFCEEIGEGSFGCILKCVKRIDGCKYAIKRSKKQAVSSGLRGALMKEGLALAALHQFNSCDTDKSNIIQYYDMWEEDSYVYLQMEYCEGGSLSSRLKRISEFCGPLKACKDRYTQEELFLLALQMARALKHCHAAGIAHLDVKPDNILQVNRNTFKLCDFGLATPCVNRVAYLDTEGDSRYLPNEVLNGTNIDLEKVDVFSLGATLYELSTNTVMRKGEKRDWGAVATGCYSETPQDFPPEFLEFVRKLLHVDPNARPSAEQIVNYLENQ